MHDAEYMLSGSPVFRAAAQGGVILASAALTAGLCLLALRGRAFCTFLTLLWLPGLLGALALPIGFFSPTPQTGRTLIALASLQGVFISPTLTLPIMGALLNAQGGLARTARGLGVGRTGQFRLIWWPLIRGRFLLGLSATSVVALGLSLLLLRFAQ